MTTVGFGAMSLQAQTGQLRGTVTTQIGSPVARAFVLATGTSGAAGGPQTARTASDGSFTYASLPVGAYRLCVQPIGDTVLDPCRWSTSPVTATVTSGQTTSIGPIKVTGGQSLKVKLIDDNGALGANQGQGKTPGAHVLVGVWSGGLFHPMRLRNQDGNSWNHDIVVPFDTQLTLTVSSTAFALSDEKGVALPNTGESVPIYIASGTTQAPIVLHVTGVKNNGH